MAFPTYTSWLTGDVLTASGVNAIATNVNLLAYLPTNAQSGTSYTLALTDVAYIVEMNNASANTVTVPPNSSVAFPVGSQLVILQTGSGQTSVAAGSGVTINSSGSKLKLTGQWSAATLIKRATNSWVLVGDITA